MRYDLETFLEAAEQVHEGKYEYNRVKIKTGEDKVIIVCPKHGGFLQRPRCHIYNKQGCPKCARENRKVTSERLAFYERRRYTTSKFIALAKKKHGNNYTYKKTKFVSSQELVIITCLTHGDFEQRPAEHLRGCGCPDCAGNKKLTTKTFIKKANEVHQNSYDYSLVKYKTAFNFVIIICPVHGKFKQLPYSHLDGMGCLKCSQPRKFLTKENFILQAIKKHGSRYDYSKTKIDGSTHSIATCPKHGDFEINIYHHYHHGISGCSRCQHSRRTSRPQEKLTQKLIDKGLEVKSNYKLAKSCEVDLYLPKYKIAIEIDGIYWHTEQYGKTKQTHLNKLLICKKIGITLFRFWDYEIENKFKIILSMIRSKLGKQNRVYARKLEIHKTEKQANAFLEKNHIQGASNHKVEYGLFEKGKMVAVMTFGTSRFSKQYEWELLRFACLSNLTVVGGASRLLTAFEREYKPKSLVSYANLRFSRGRVYTQLGFIFSHRSQPNYFYARGGLLLSRYKTQKHKLKVLLSSTYNEKESESVNMIRNGFHKIWDCGNLVYEKSY